ncbi:hypothetical protein [Flammeovirga kamogawensis]|uniref:Uncharacterized protein n=1 Tax=Flammeovirga kamogawensis TaxID=373891 RepID=A0ABX8H248_9BACT|nr:hypothetical protein [Flammeovirga kamogawensis]MBB6462562.1 hypothetical protein [Flammeovirga kamogawensis]QWG09689.1 hypothetical protein KM029_24100 [Flammeovirga kamogawensis]TRX65201.1 hypothetical protein EO216_21995 [Flammeovirga kamogawensis]
MKQFILFFLSIIFIQLSTYADDYPKKVKINGNSAVITIYTIESQYQQKIQNLDKQVTISNDSGVKVDMYSDGEQNAAVVKCGAKYGVVMFENNVDFEKTITDLVEVTHEN